LQVLKKRKAIACSVLENDFSANCYTNHTNLQQTDQKDNQIRQNSDESLQQVRKHLKQALQQFTNSTVQLELENSIKALDQARVFANLDFLKQADEVFHQKLDVQEQLDDFKKEVNSKLNQVLQQMIQTKVQIAEKSAFVFTQSNKTNSVSFAQANKTNTITFEQLTLAKNSKSAKPATYASVANSKEQNDQQA